MTTTAPKTDLATAFRGQLIRPDDEGYDVHRHGWNGSIDKRPALIAKATGVADVIAALRHAREDGLQVAVRGGGHSFPGHSTVDDGIIIDLGPMKGIRVDPDRRVARAQAGVLLGELDRETQQFGMAVPSGIVTHTGVAGLTLGGGIGWIMRKYGLSIDQLLSVDMVTAEGEFVTASKDVNPELFWGVRGGGGNFGIVTEFEFNLNPVGPTVMAGPIMWAMEDSPDVMRFYSEWAPTLPDEITTIVVHRRAPALPVVPEELHGRHVVMVIPCYVGSLEEAEKVIAPLRAFGKPLLDLCKPKPFLMHQAMLDPGFVHGRWFYFKSLDIDVIDNKVIDVLVSHSMNMESKMSGVPIFQLGGAVSRVGDDDTAYNGRSRNYTFNINGTTQTSDGFAEEQAWVRGLYDALEPHSAGAYVNFLQDEGEERIRQAYGAAKYDRLKALKRTWDPDNVFRLNQNISPD